MIDGLARAEVAVDSGVFYSDRASLPGSIPVPTLRVGSLAALALLMLFVGWATLRMHTVAKFPGQTLLGQPGRF